MLVFAVEGLEPFAGKHLVELAKSIRAVRSLVERVAGAHQLVDDAANDLRRVGGTVVRLREHRVEDVGHPVVARRPVVHPLGVEFLEERGDVRA